MPLAVNAAKARLKKNELAVGIGIRLVRNVDIIKVMKAAGFDWLFLDLEHGSLSIETACEISVAAQDSGIAPIVRVPHGECVRFELVESRDIELRHLCRDARPKRPNLRK